MGLRDGGQGLVSVAPLVLLPTDNHEACAPISVPLGRGCTPARQPAGEGEHGVSRVLRGREHTAARLLHPSNHHAQRLPTEMQDKSSHWRRRRELDMGYGPWPPGRARALGCRQAAAVVIHGAVGLVPVEIELVCLCLPSRAAVFLLVAAELQPVAQRELRRTLSPYRSPLGPGTARCPSTSCRGLYSCRYKI